MMVTALCCRIAKCERIGVHVRELGDPVTDEVNLLRFTIKNSVSEVDAAHSTEETASVPPHELGRWTFLIEEAGGVTE